MMKHRWNTLRPIAIAVVTAFAAQQVAFAAPALPTMLPVSLKPEVGFVLPASVAIVDDAYKAPGDARMVILIQDAHTNDSGQMNVAKALEEVLPKEGITTVFTEGDSADVSFGYMKPYFDQKVREDVGRKMVRAGEMRGHDYASLTGKTDFRLLGVEDPALYVQTLELYQDIVKKRAKVRAYLDSVRRSATAIQDEYFSAELKDLEAKRLAQKADELPLADYAQTLLAAASKAGVTVARYPHVKFLRRLKTMEGRIDFKKASAEEREALKVLPAADREELLAAHKVAKKTASIENAFYALFEEKLAASGLNKRFGELNRYLRYVKETRKMNAMGVIGEVRGLEEEVFLKLAGDRNAAILWMFGRNLETLEALVSLKVSPEEFNLTRSQAALYDIKLIAGFINGRIIEAGRHYGSAVTLEEAFDAARRDAEAFYELTLARDRHFLDRVQQIMEAEDLKKSVLVTGGYHTPNLKSMLRSAGYSYVSLLPQVLHETDADRYERILLSQLDKKLSGQGARVVFTEGADQDSSLSVETAMPRASHLTAASRLANTVEPNPLADSTRREFLRKGSVFGVLFALAAKTDESAAGVTLFNGLSTDTKINDLGDGFRAVWGEGFAGVNIDPKVKDGAKKIGELSKADGIKIYVGKEHKDVQVFPRFMTKAQVEDQQHAQENYFISMPYAVDQEGFVTVMYKDVKKADQPTFDPTDIGHISLHYGQISLGTTHIMTRILPKSDFQITGIKLVVGQSDNQAEASIPDSEKKAPAGEVIEGEIQYDNSELDAQRKQEQVYPQTWESSWLQLPPGAAFDLKPGDEIDFIFSEASLRKFLPVLHYVKDGTKRIMRPWKSQPMNNKETVTLTIPRNYPIDGIFRIEASTGRNAHGSNLNIDNFGPKLIGVRIRRAPQGARLAQIVLPGWVEGTEQPLKNHVMNNWVPRMPNDLNQEGLSTLAPHQLIDGAEYGAATPTHVGDYSQIPTTQEYLEDAAAGHVPVLMAAGAAMRFAAMVAGLAKGTFSLQNLIDLQGVLEEMSEGDNLELYKLVSGKNIADIDPAVIKRVKAALAAKHTFTVSNEGRPVSEQYGLMNMGFEKKSKPEDSEESKNQVLIENFVKNFEIVQKVLAQAQSVPAELAKLVKLGWDKAVVRNLTRLPLSSIQVLMFAVQIRVEAGELYDSKHPQGGTSDERNQFVEEFVKKNGRIIININEETGSDVLNGLHRYKFFGLQPIIVQSPMIPLLNADPQSGQIVYSDNPDAAHPYGHIFVSWLLRHKGSAYVIDEENTTDDNLVFKLDPEGRSALKVAQSLGGKHFYNVNIDDMRFFSEPIPGAIKKMYDPESPLYNADGAFYAATNQTGQKGGAVVKVTLRDGSVRDISLEAPELLLVEQMIKDNDPGESEKFGKSKTTLLNRMTVIERLTDDAMDIDKFTEFMNAVNIVVSFKDLGDGATGHVAESYFTKAETLTAVLLSVTGGADGPVDHLGLKAVPDAGTLNYAQSATKAVNNPIAYELLQRYGSSDLGPEGAQLVVDKSPETATLPASEPVVLTAGEFDAIDTWAGNVVPTTTVDLETKFKDIWKVGPLAEGMIKLVHTASSSDRDFLPILIHIPSEVAGQEGTNYLITFTLKSMLDTSQGGLVVTTVLKEVSPGGSIVDSALTASQTQASTAQIGVAVPEGSTIRALDLEVEAAATKSIMEDRVGIYELGLATNAGIVSSGTLVAHTGVMGEKGVLKPAERKAAFKNWALSQKDVQKAGHSNYKGLFWVPNQADAEEFEGYIKELTRDGKIVADAVQILVGNQPVDKDMFVTILRSSPDDFKGSAHWEKTPDKQPYGSLLIPKLTRQSMTNWSAGALAHLRTIAATGKTTAAEIKEAIKNNKIVDRSQWEKIRMTLSKEAQDLINTFEEYMSHYNLGTFPVGATIRSHTMSLNGWLLMVQMMTAAVESAA